MSNENKLKDFYIKRNREYIGYTEPFQQNILITVGKKN